MCVVWGGGGVDLPATASFSISLINYCLYIDLKQYQFTAGYQVLIFNIANRRSVLKTVNLHCYIQLNVHLYVNLFTSSLRL